MLTRSILVVPIVLSSLSGAACAGTAAQTFTCKPALPVFCRNIHVSCAGATKIRTAAFEMLISGAEARVRFDGSERVIQGQVGAGRDLVIRLETSRDWIRIQADGRFSHRIYRAGGASMSYGTCVSQSG